MICLIDLDDVAPRSCKWYVDRVIVKNKVVKDENRDKHSNLLIYWPSMILSGRALAEDFEKLSKFFQAVKKFDAAPVALNEEYSERPYRS